MKTTHTTPRRLLIVLNPVAGAHARSHIDLVVAALAQRGIHAEIYETRSAGDAITALPKLTADFDIVVAAGGDGTVNEVLNGIRGSHVTLGIIPCGTTNVLATELGLPEKPDAIAAVLASDHTRDIYSGDVNGRRFGMMVGIGYDAWVVAGVAPALKQKIGKLAYVLSMIRELKHFGSRQYQLQIDDSVHTAAAVVATLGRHYAGSYIFARNARIDEPAIDVLLVQTLNRWAFLLMLLALPLGFAERLPFMKTVKGRHIHITPYPAAAENTVPESLQADGDSIGFLPATLSVIEPALKVLAPPLV
jgi:YegS/Rv2252/BmrU family lipid kinase